MRRNGDSFIDSVIENITMDFVGFMLIVFAIVGAIFSWKVGFFRNEIVAPYIITFLMGLAVLGAFLIYFCGKRE